MEYWAMGYDDEHWGYGEEEGDNHEHWGYREEDDRCL